MRKAKGVEECNTQLTTNGVHTTRQKHGCVCRVGVTTRAAGKRAFVALLPSSLSNDTTRRGVLFYHRAWHARTHTHKTVRCDSQNQDSHPRSHHRHLNAGRRHHGYEHAAGVARAAAHEGEDEDADEDGDDAAVPLLDVVPGHALYTEEGETVCGEVRRELVGDSAKMGSAAECAPPFPAAARRGGSFPELPWEGRTAPASCGALCPEWERASSSFAFPFFFWTWCSLFDVHRIGNPFKKNVEARRKKQKNSHTPQHTVVALLKCPPDRRASKEGRD